MMADYGCEYPRSKPKENMPTHKSAREILELLRCDIINSVEDGTIDPPEELRRQREFINTALAQLAELVRGDKKNIECTGDPDCDCYDNKRYNEAIEHIARLIEGK